MVTTDISERGERGRAMRRAVPRSSHGEWTPPANRADPAAILAAQEVTRVPELVPLRHERMMVSPFTFYRGAAAIMAADLASTPVSGITVQACGDAHLANFGGFASPERRMLFDINDFDETLPGPWEWDVKRLAASFAIAAQDREFDEAFARAVVARVVGTYREAMRQFAAMRDLDVWYAYLDVDGVMARWRTQATRAELKRLERGLAKAENKNSLKAFAKLTENVDGHVRIISDPPLIVRWEDLPEYDQSVDIFAQLGLLLDMYSETLTSDRQVLLSRYRFVDFARKVVGVGSVGTRCWIGLLLGRDDDDPLFLQVKEAEASVLEPFAAKAVQSSHGERVVQGQRLMQAASDIFLGWNRVTNPDSVTRDYYIRQLWDGKISLDLTAVQPSALAIYAEMCGWTLARAHARSGDRHAIAAYLGAGDTFDRALVEFATAYAAQNVRDYHAVADALREGRLPA
jgi:uncharacterized protein (DUF2252 family)